MRSVTQTQRQALGFMEAFIEEEGRPPSITEAGDAWEISRPTAQSMFNALERKGYIARTGPRFDSLIITDAGRKALRGTQNGTA